VHTPMGYAIRYEVNGTSVHRNAEANDNGEAHLFQFAADAVQVGEQIFLTEPDGRKLRFRVAAMM